MTESVYNEMVRRIMQAAPVPQLLAEEYAGLIGDTPEIQGTEIVVRDEFGEERARLPRGVFPVEVE